MKKASAGRRRRTNIPGERTNCRKLPQPEYLPVSVSEAKKCYGSEDLDVVLITGDAYIDQPSFGVAIIGRYLVAHGFSVGIIPQPDWKNDEDFKVLGKPKLFFGITAGCTDSMVSNYSPSKKKRRTDEYSPNGVTGRRPDRATIVYSHAVRKAWKDVPLILGGIEASLRRFAHYDYWEDRVRQSVLADAHADLLVYGMGELQVVEIARRLESGEKISEIRDVNGTVWKSGYKPEDALEIPSFAEVSASREKFAEAFLKVMKHNHPGSKKICQRQSKEWVVQNPPMPPVSQKELDFIYSLPFTRKKHPVYGNAKIPAEHTAKFSIVTHRGCFGGCAFCAISYHQGKVVVSRSMNSIIAEVKRLAMHSEFRGIINDVGGPSANMYGMHCKKTANPESCKRICLFPDICPNLEASHEPLIALLRKLRNLPYVKKVFVQSGIRYDLALLSKEYIEEISRHHISGQLKVAPEHIEYAVTKHMRKPDGKKFIEFLEVFAEIQRKIGKKQYIIPYFMSGHPGCRIEHMVSLAKFIRKLGFFIEHVQEFTPTPGTLSTCMFYTGFDPYTGEKLHVPSREERIVQRALLQFQNKKCQKIIRRFEKKHNVKILFSLLGET
ncbi:MAG: YgiQ family radical SAM protein [Thermoplasmata archaeon]